MTVNNHVARIAIVGTGHRAQTFTEGLARRPHCAWPRCATATRCAWRTTTGCWPRPASRRPRTWAPDDFEKMLRHGRHRQVVVTTVDATHDHVHRGRAARPAAGS